MSFLCEYCSNIYTSKYLLSRHQNSESCKKIQNVINNYNNRNNEKIKEIENKFQDKIKEIEANYSEKIKLLELEVSKLTQENTSLKSENKSLEKSNESFRKIVEKAATKSTNTIKNNNNYSHNNYLNYISTEPLKMSDIPKQIKQFVNCETVMYDDSDFHDHIVDNILKDKNGKDKILCTDINRKNFTYKDETSGELISDPELERLREQFKKGSDIRQIRRDLLEKLVVEYEENGSIGVDPYKRFSDIIQKLNFGSPFVDHVAKKTYVKRCSTVKTNTLEKNSEIINKIEEDIEYSEEEYQKLLEEFGDEPFPILGPPTGQSGE